MRVARTFRIYSCTEVVNNHIGGFGGTQQSLTFRLASAQFIFKHIGPEQLMKFRPCDLILRSKAEIWTPARLPVPAILFALCSRAMRTLSGSNQQIFRLEIFCLCCAINTHTPSASIFIELKQSARCSIEVNPRHQTVKLDHHARLQTTAINSRSARGR